MENPLPPHDVAAERAILGSVIIRPDVLEVVAARLDRDDFFVPRHRDIYANMLEAHRRGDAIDPIAVMPPNSHDRGELLTMAQETPTAEHVESYIRIVVECSVRRRVMHFGARLQSDAAGEHDLAELLSGLQVEALQLSTRNRAPGIERVSEIMPRALEELDARSQGARGATYPLCIDELADVIGALGPGRLIIVGARPSVGKTALALDVLLGGAARGFPGLMFSREMTKQELAERLLSKRSRIAANRLHFASPRAPIQYEELRRLWGVAGPIAEMPLWVDDTSSRIEQLVTEARRFKAAIGDTPGLIVIDYIQLIKTRPSPQRNREREIAEMSMILKNDIAKALNLPVLALAQLNRDSAKGKERPRMHQLRESGALEADADCVILLHRDIEDEACSTVEAIVEKNRHGRTGIKILPWHGPTMTVGRIGRWDASEVNGA